MGRREGVRDWITDDEVVAFATALLDAGAHLDVRDDLLRSTPLGWACRWGRARLVTLMLERGADPAEPDAEPWATPRAWAEKMNHSAVLAVLREDADRQ
jgi:ankyrin repeat protein